MNDLKKIVTNLRDVARDTARMRSIGNLIAKIHNLTIKITNLKKDSEECKKDAALELAVAEYAVTKLDKAHPLHEDMKKEADQCVKYAKDGVDEAQENENNNKEEIKELEENIKKEEEKIVKFENGTSKVDKDKLNERVKKYVEEAGLEAARSLVELTK